MKAVIGGRAHRPAASNDVARRFYEAALQPKRIAASSAAMLALLPAGAALRLSFLTPWAPREDDALIAMWQVHAAFISIGFAGLAIAFQVLAEPPLTAGPARTAVVHHLRYRELLAHGVTANGLIGISAIWLRSDANVAIGGALLFAPSVALTALAYVRLADLFADPDIVERMTLDDLKLRVQRALLGSPFKQAADELKAAIDARENWHRRPRRGLAERRSDLVRHDRAAGIVTAVRVSALEQGVALLDAEGPAVVSDHTAKEVGATDPTAIAIYVSPGDRVHHRSVLAEVFLPNIDIPQAVREKASVAFRNAFVISPTQADPVEVLKGDLSHLQDSIIRAIREGSLARVQRGYRYYAEVIRDAGGAAGPSWRWLERQTWEIDDTAVEGGGRMSMLSIEAAADRFRSGVVRGDDVAMAAALSAYVHLWERLLMLPAIESKYAKEYLLVSLQNQCELYLPTQSVGGVPDLQAAARCVWAFVELAKASIDRNATEDADRVLGYVSGLFRYGNAEYAPVRRQVAAGLLALGAWVLYLRTERGEVNGNLGRIVGLLAEMPVMEALKILEGREEFAGRWRFWETEDALPLEVSTLSIDTYALQAGLLGLRARPRFVLADDDSESLGERLLGQVDAIREAWPLDVARGDELRALQDALTRALEERKRAASAELAERSLDAGKVSAFRARFGEALASPRRLSDLFAMATAGDHATEMERRLLFLNLIVPRVFLATHSRVLADPTALASSMAGAMVRAEDEAILHHCRMVGVSTKVDMASVADATARVVASMSRPLVVLMNSGEVIDLLATNHEALWVRVDDKVAPAFALYGVESTEQVLIVDLDLAPALRREAEEKDGLEEVAGADVAVGIFEDVPWDPDGDEPKVRVETGEWIQWFVPTQLAAHFLSVHDATW